MPCCLRRVRRAGFRFGSRRDKRRPRIHHPVSGCARCWTFPRCDRLVAPGPPRPLSCDRPLFLPASECDAAAPTRAGSAVHPSCTDAVDAQCRRASQARSACAARRDMPVFRMSAFCMSAPRTRHGFPRRGLLRSGRPCKFVRTGSVLRDRLRFCDRDGRHRPVRATPG
jgi:hypothetical protein